MYRVLYRAWGRQHWWPAASPFEVIVGAFLTQNTAWTNVEKAMAELRRHRALSISAIRRLPVDDLGTLIRSSGYFRQKAARLKGFVAFLDRQYGGSLSRMLAQSTGELRQQLLSLNGVGPETADSILLYAGNHPVFVVDAYTRRILDRHGIMTYNAPYEKIRGLCEQALNHVSCLDPSETDTETETETPGHSPSRMSTAARCPTAQVFNEMHGLFVGVAKNYCLKSKALCGTCPLSPLLTRTHRDRLRREGLLASAPAPEAAENKLRAQS